MAKAGLSCGRQIVAGRGEGEHEKDVMKKDFMWYAKSCFLRDNGSFAIYSQDTDDRSQAETSVRRFREVFVI
jgi:hypothetical protein